MIDQEPDTFAAQNCFTARAAHQSHELVAVAEWLEVARRAADQNVAALMREAGALILETANSFTLNGSDESAAADF